MPFNAIQKKTGIGKAPPLLSLVCCLILSGCTGTLDGLENQTGEPDTARAALSKIAGADQSVTLSIAPFSVVDAVRLAILTSPAVQAANYQLSVADNQILIQKSAYFPEIYYEVSPVGEDDMLASAAAGLRYTLYDFGARAAKTNSALWAKRSASAFLIKSIDEIAFDAIQSYIELAAAEDNLANTKALLRTLQEERSIIADRVQSGASNEAELQSVNIGVIRAEARQVEVAVERDRARTKLTSVSGVNFKSVAILKSLNKLFSISEGPLDVEKTPLVVAATAERASAEEELKAAKANLFPGLGIRAGASTRVTDNIGFTAGGLSIGPSIGGSISLGQGRQYAVKNAELQVSVAQSNISTAQRDVVLKDKNARLKLKALQDSYRLRKEVVSRGEELTRLRRAEYEAGSSNVSDIVDAIEEEYAARAAVITNSASILISKVEILLNTGQLQSLFFYGNDDRFDRKLPPQPKTVKS